MNNNLIFSYNNKVYKTEATMKKAKTMDAKRAAKENKKQTYHKKHGSEKIKAAVEKRAIKKDQKDFPKQLLNIGSTYDEERKKEFKINKDEIIRERKKYEQGQALGSFKVVSYHDILHYEKIVPFISSFSGEKIYYEVLVPNIPVIKQNIESELRKQIASNNSKHKLSCFITIKYMLTVDDPEEKKVKIEQRYFNSDIINLTSSHVISGFINYLIKSFEQELEMAQKTSGLIFLGIEKLSIKTAKSKAMVGGSYIELPEFIKNKRACVNIKNDD